MAALLPGLLPFFSPPGVSWIGHASGLLVEFSPPFAVVQGTGEG